MAKPLKICSQCLASLRQSSEGEQDLSSFLIGIGAGGVEIVPAETCEARITGHRETLKTPPPASRSLADVTPGELDQAIASLVKQLRLPAGRSAENWNLENAIKAEWLRAREAKSRERPQG